MAQRWLAVSVGTVLAKRPRPADLIRLCSAVAGASETPNVLRNINSPHSLNPSLMRISKTALRKAKGTMAHRRGGRWSGHIRLRMALSVDSFIGASLTANCNEPLAFPWRNTEFAFWRVLPYFTVLTSHRSYGCILTALSLYVVHCLNSKAHCYWAYMLDDDCVHQLILLLIWSSLSGL